LLVIFLFSTSFVLAEKPPYENYLLKRDYYLSSHQSYIDAKQTYLNYETLQTKEKFFSSFKFFLVSRNELLKSYLFVLLNQGSGFLPEGRLDGIRAWINWLDEDTQQINKFVSVSELTDAAGYLKIKYPQIEEEIFSFLVELTIAQQNLIEKDIRQLISRIGHLDPAVSKWLDEVKKQLDLADQSQETAMSKIKNARIRRIGDGFRVWQKGQKDLSQANERLEKALSFLDEIIKKSE